MKIDIFPQVQDGYSWKLLGLFFPSFWLTGIGPRGLLEKGGLIMRLAGKKPTRAGISLTGLMWLLLGIVAAWGLEFWKLGSGVVAGFLHGLSYCGLMSALGVFLFLALAPESLPPGP